MLILVAIRTVVVATLVAVLFLHLLQLLPCYYRRQIATTTLCNFVVFRPTSSPVILFNSAFHLGPAVSYPNWDLLFSSLGDVT